MHEYHVTGAARLAIMVLDRSERYIFPHDDEAGHDWHESHDDPTPSCIHCAIANYWRGAGPIGFEGAVIGLALHVIRNTPIPIPSPPGQG